jgi:F420-non-reducing hydrogenase iron-sulfur subunit
MANGFNFLRSLDLSPESEWEPKLLGFLCRWCSYAGADLAGTSRKKYPANIRIIKVPCSGRVDSLFILKALRLGFDGVLVSGCHPGDCHYQTGNYKCLRRYHLLQKYIQQMGIEKERLRLEWISASEGKQFAELVDKYTGTIKALGPCRVKEVMEKLT